MPITTYSELMTAAANWQHRTAPSFMGRVADFVALFEAHANATLRLRENEVESALAATVASPFIDLPADLHEPVSLMVTSTRRRLVYRAPDQLAYHSPPGPSERWTLADTRIRTERAADRVYDYSLRYHRRFALSADAPANALLTRYPNVYLYGALLEAAPYVRDVRIVDLWQERYDRAVAALERAEGAHRRKAATLSVDPALARRAAFGLVEG